MVIIIFILLLIVAILISIQLGIVIRCMHNKTIIKGGINCRDIFSDSRDIFSDSRDIFSEYLFDNKPFNELYPNDNISKEDLLLIPHNNEKGISWFEDYFKIKEDRLLDLIKDKYNFYYSYDQNDENENGYDNIFFNIGEINFKIGNFSFDSIDGLKIDMDNMPKEKWAYRNKNIGYSYEYIIKDISLIINNPAFNYKNSVFQAASQFNLLEMENPGQTLRDGISIYVNNKSQGPRVALSSPAGTFFRNYLLLRGGDLNSDNLDNTYGLNILSNVLDTLDIKTCPIHDIAEGFYSYKNGYIKIMMPQTVSLEKLKKTMEEGFVVGIHWNTPLLINCDRRVCQIYTPALPIKDMEYDIEDEKVKNLAICIYLYSFKCVLQAAVNNLLKYNQPYVNVFLTAVGTFTFGNKIEWVQEALVDAIYEYKDWPLRIYMVGYGGGDKELFTDVVNAAINKMDNIGIITKYVPDPHKKPPNPVNVIPHYSGGKEWFSDYFEFAESLATKVTFRCDVVSENPIIYKNIFFETAIRYFKVGDFSCISLSKLCASSAQNNSLIDNTGAKYNYVKGDISTIINNIADINNVVIQAASQFNLLEMYDCDNFYTPELGICAYASDPTQGPRVALSSPAGTFFRNYLIFNGNPQTSGNMGVYKQINGLKPVLEQLKIPEIDISEMNELSKNVYAYKNGYAIVVMPEGENRTFDELLNITDEFLQVGIQWNSPLLIDNNKKLCQVYSSALPIAYYKEASKENIEHLATSILTSTFKCALQVAVNKLYQQKSSRISVYLTAVGGGSFGNEPIWVQKALILAIDIYRNFPLDIYMIGYGNNLLPELFPSNMFNGNCECDINISALPNAPTPLIKNEYGGDIITELTPIELTNKTKKMKDIEIATKKEESKRKKEDKLAEWNTKTLDEKEKEILDDYIISHANRESMKKNDRMRNLGPEEKKIKLNIEIENIRNDPDGEIMINVKKMLANNKVKVKKGNPDLNEEGILDFIYKKRNSIF